MNKKLVFLSLIFVVACSQRNNAFKPVGEVCGKSSIKEFKNPLAIENLNTKYFSVISEVPVKQEYKADSVVLYFKNTTGDGEEIMYTHHPVYVIGEADTVSKAFTKSCSRGNSIDTTAWTFSATLPIEMTLTEDLKLKATRSADYTVKFGKDLKEEGYLVGEVSDGAGPSPSSTSDFGFSEFAVLQQTGKLTKKEKKSFKLHPEKAYDKLFIQFKVSDTPLVYARITLLKVK